MLMPCTTPKNIRSTSLMLVMGLATAISILIPTTTSVAENPPGNFSGGPKTIASKERVSILIDREIEQTKSFIILKISVPTDSKINAFLLSDPPRLVIDFDGASVKKSENFVAPANGVIKQVRLGAHPEKLRVVVDLIQSTPPEYEWKAGKRQAIIKILESTHAASPSQPSSPPVAATPTLAPVATTAVPAQAAQATPTMAPTPSLTATPTIVATTTAPSAPTETSGPTLSDVEKAAPLGASAGATNAGAPPKAALPDYQTGADDVAVENSQDLGDLESSKQAGQPQKVATTFSITGYKFERLPDKTPVLKIILNKPKAQAEISKVDEETYKIILRDCGLANEDLELPQFPPHDFVGFVMIVAETVGKDTEISVSTEGDMALTTSMHDQEIWVKKP